MSQPQSFFLAQNRLVKEPTSKPDGQRAGWDLEHAYAELPQLFYSNAAPTAVREPRLAAFNRPLATMLGLEPEAREGSEGAAIFGGHVVPEGGRPIAQAYAGHQFGHFHRPWRWPRDPARRRKPS